MKGNCSKLSRHNGSAFELIKGRLSINVPSRSREIIEKEISLDCDPNGGSPTQEKSPGTKTLGDLTVEVLRIRVLHPDIPEQICGADLIYERHYIEDGEVSFAAVQYKIWEDQKMSLGDPRLNSQLEKLKKSFCDKKVCHESQDGYRFPCCSAFLRPTDRLQSASQALRSSGEHLPICKIKDVQSLSVQKKPILEWQKIRGTSLSAHAFDELFIDGRVGSARMKPQRLIDIYKDFLSEAGEDTLVLYAQEIQGLTR